MKRKISLLLVLATCIITLFSACGSKEPTTIMAIDGHEVDNELYMYIYENYKDDYPELTHDELAKKTEEALIDIYAVISLSVDYDLNDDDNFYSNKEDTAVEDAINSSGGKSKFNEELKKNHMTENVFRFLTTKENLSEELYYAMINAGDIITDKDKMIEVASSDEFICVKQILIVGDREVSDTDAYYTPAKTHTDEEAEQIANQVRERALTGTDFDELVVEYGESFYMMEHGDGYYLCRGMWEEENETAVFSLEINEISDVVKSSAGYSVFMRCDKSLLYIKNNIDDIIDNYANSVYTLALEKRAEEISTKIIYTEAYDTLITTSEEK